MAATPCVSAAPASTASRAAAQDTIVIVGSIDIVAPLECDDMHKTYALTGGRENHLRELRQWWSYEGVLEDAPSPDMNGHQLAAPVWVVE